MLIFDLIYRRYYLSVVGSITSGVIRAILPDIAATCLGAGFGNEELGVADLSDRDNDSGSSSSLQNHDEVGDTGATVFSTQSSARLSPTPGHASLFIGPYASVSGLSDPANTILDHNASIDPPPPPTHSYQYVNEMLRIEELKRDPDHEGNILTKSAIREEGSQTVYEVGTCVGSITRYT